MDKIWLFGDSVLKGVMFSAEKKAYSLYKRDLGLGEGQTVVNRAAFGATAPKVRAELERSLPEDASGDRVILSFGGNDSDFDWRKVSAAPEKEHSPRVPAEVFAGILRGCVETVRRRGAEVFVTSLVPINPSRFLDFISRGLDRDSIMSWLGDESMLYRWHEHYDVVTRDTAAGLGVPVIDLRAPFLLSHRFTQLLCGDGMHPTAQGHRMIDGCLAGALA
ncbi:MAG: SGNH/GDSL hydrolase family protein [Oscillospiraceae bacterium]|nr:SGNH/GDSL hydrolase family protein [Oscillospiraceae bacterium]